MQKAARPLHPHVRFADSNAAVKIYAPTLQELTLLAAQVQGLVMPSDANAARLTSGDSQPALRRALAVRRLLEERGMDARKVQVRYYGAGPFAADNASREVKAANRLVEIELQKPDTAPTERRSGLSPTIAALIVCQIALHGAMAGVRTAAPLLALHAGVNAWSLGLLLALFAVAPLLQGLHAGRLADRYGYHRPMVIAVVLTMLGVLAALGATYLAMPWQFALTCVAAMLCGAGANMGLIAIQRTGGRTAQGGSEHMRVFSWLGLAYALANFFGSVTAGLLIDLVGFPAAFSFMLLLPLVSLWVGKYIPQEPPSARPGPVLPRQSSLLRLPALRRLLLINWLFSASWDVHTFAVPVLGHARGYSASTIGLVLGTFPLAVGLVRFVIPMAAHRLDEVRILRGAMVGTALVCAVYPFAPSAALMAGCAALLGMTLGAAQPMILSALHRWSPEHRHGEAIAWRSITVNTASTVMPLVFGVAGAVVGASGLFFVMAAMLVAGSHITSQLHPQAR